MDDSDDDEDLKRAIALSLQDANPTVATEKEIISIDSDDETTDDESSTLQVQSTHVKAEPQTLNSMLGLDRKAMEQERLARKRKASISPPPNARKSQKLPSLSLQRDDPPQRVSEATTTSSSAIQTNHATAKGPDNDTLGPLSFPKGVVKKTWAFGHARTENDIKIEEVLQRRDLQLAVLSSFHWDVEWLLQKLDIHRTQIVMVMQAKEESTRRQYERETASMPNLRLCFPPMDGQVNCMHSKLMLLSYPGYLRIVIPSANLVPYDWGETGVMENSAFLIDLPRLQATHPSANSADAMTPFAQELIYFLKAMRLDTTIIQSVSNFDFTATRDYGFVHTIGGAHTGDAWRRTGYPGLARAVTQLNLQTQGKLAVDFVASSIGALNYDFVSALYGAAQGEDMLVECTREKYATKQAKRQRPAGPEREELVEALKANFRIYFPTHNTVASSKGGIDNAGTICFQRKWYCSKNFPSELMRDCKSVRKGLLMHNKVSYMNIECRLPYWSAFSSCVLCP